MLAQCDFAHRQHVGSMLDRRTCTAVFITMLAQRGTNVIFTQRHETHVGPTACVLYIGIWFSINPSSQMTINSLEKLISPHFVFCSVSRSKMAFR